jgi:transposase
VAGHKDVDTALLTPKEVVDASQRPLGEDVSEILEYVPGRYQVIRHVRPKLSCAVCQKIVQVPAPSRPIARGLAGSGFLAHVLVSKYCDHHPPHMSVCDPLKYKHLRDAAANFLSNC